MSVRPLFDRYPRLRSRVPHRVLGPMHTPVERLGRLSKHLAHEVWIKRDDQTADPYGGNKTRKLEFLLGEALDSGARRVITYGYAGSNHCLATAVHARRLGLSSTSMLFPLAAAGEGDEARISRNVLATHAVGSRCVALDGRWAMRPATAREVARGVIRDGRRPQVVVPGGSSPVGVLGYVNAGIELVDQILAGRMPQPAQIYLPFGTVGTTVGLAIGLGLAGMPIPVVPVSILDPKVSDRRTFERLFGQTIAWLRHRDRGVPQLLPPRIRLEGGQLGRGYGIASPGSRAAARLAGQIEGLKVETTYGGKALAALMADAATKRLARGPSLFWHTYDARDPSPAPVAATELPLALRRYVD